MPVLTVILLAVAACGAPTTEDGVPLAPEESPAVVGTPSTRVWDGWEGWYDLPPAPVAAPVERWRQQFPPGTNVAADREGSAVAVAHAAGTETTVNLLDPVSGAPRWTTTVPDSLGRVDSIDVISPADGHPALVQVIETNSDFEFGEGYDRTRLTLLSGDDGRVLRTVPGVITPEPVLGGVVLLGVDPDGREGIVSAALDRATGAELWRAESGVVVASGGMPVVQRVDDAAAEDASYDENLRLQVESTLEVLDPATGAVRARVPLPAGASKSVVDGLLVVTTVGPTDRATVTAYRLDDGGTKVWETDVGAIGEEPVAAPFGDDALLIHDWIDASGDDGRSLAVVDRATGALRAEQPGDLTLTAMSLDGAPGLLGIDGSRLEFRDAAGGRLAVEGVSRWWPAGGAVLGDDAGSLTARSLPDLSPRWRIDGVPELDPVDVYQDRGLVFPVPDGVVVVSPQLDPSFYKDRPPTPVTVAGYLA
jgi:hypothetical protein